MSASRFLSPSWHRVAGLKPRLAEQAQVHRHRYRGRTWYVIDDRQAERVHRFTPAAYQIISRFDGKTTIDDIWKRTLESAGRHAPGQEEVIQLLGQLHANDLMKCDVVPDTAELFARFDRQANALWWANLKNPLAIRIPLWDADAFLVRTLPWVRPLFSRWFFVVWLATVATGLILAGEHWAELSENLSDRVLAADNLLLIWLSFPLIKALHELGHGYATRHFGGEVHEIGVMLLALMVVPYVNANASAGFRSRYRRALVGAAGMMVELFIAALATMLWIAIEQGVLRAVLFDVMLIAGVSTLVFNGNPLLRYDGYYILSDLLEIPNLGLRANRYWMRLLQHRLFKLHPPEPAETTPGERRWFLLYAPLALVYRVLVMVGIALFLAEEFFVIGAMLAMWTAFSMLVLPLLKGVWFVLFNPALSHRRRRAVLVTGLLTVTAATFAALVPLPLRTQAEGVLWLPEQSEVRAGTSGFVKRVVAKPGAEVRPGELLIECEEPVLQAEITVYRARVEEVRTQRAAEWIEDRVAAEVSRQELERAEGNLARAEQRAERLAIRSPIAGRFALARDQDLPGRFVKQGELIGFVVAGTANRVRVVVPQDDIDLVRRNTQGVQVRFANRLETVLAADIIREVPSGKAELPSPAFSTEGGGRQAMDPRDPKHATALDRVFQFDLEVPEAAAALTGDDGTVAYGSRAHVRFLHHPEPAAHQAWRRLRQLFLSRIHV